MQDLIIALIQAEIVWEEHDANLDIFHEKIARVQNGVQLIVLPEMFSTGFSMHPERLAQRMNGKVVAWMKERSHETRADVVGSLIIEEDGKFHNRLLWVKPDGTLFSYDKKHLFRYAGEEKVYTSGNRHLLVDCHGWMIRPFICYDLRFPIWTRNIDNLFDAAIFVANWPEQRSAHWKSLLVARAIENQCYVAGVNRVGVDGNGYQYSGDSCIIDPMGRTIIQKSYEETILIGKLCATDMINYRKAFPAWMDADGEMLINE